MFIEARPETLVLEPESPTPLLGSIEVGIGTSKPVPWSPVLESRSIKAEPKALGLVLSFSAASMQVTSARIIYVYLGKSN